MRGDVLVRNTILIGLLGDSKRYENSKYIFEDGKYEESWFSTKAIYEHLKRRGVSISKIILIGPNNKTVKKSFYDGWQKDDVIEKTCHEKDNIVPKPSIKSLFGDVDLEEKLLDESRYGEMEYLFEKIEEIIHKVEEECAYPLHIYIDLTHGYRHVPLVLIPYIQKLILTNENITVDGVYYGGKQISQREYEVLDLTGLINMLNALGYIRDFRERAASETLFRLIREKKYFSKSRKIKNEINAFKDHLYLLLNGAVDGETIKKIKDSLGKIEEFLMCEKTLSLPEKIIGLELMKSGREIMVMVEKEEKIWARQLILSKILLNRRLDIRTALSLIRESFISWIIEEGFERKDPFDAKTRKLVSGENGEYNYLWHIVVRQIIFNEFEKIIDKRNAYAHVLTDENLKKEISGKIGKEIKNIVKGIDELLKKMGDKRTRECIKKSVTLRDKIKDIINSEKEDSEKIKMIKEMLCGEC